MLIVLHPHQGSGRASTEAAGRATCQYKPRRPPAAVVAAAFPEGNRQFNPFSKDPFTLANNDRMFGFCSRQGLGMKKPAGSGRARLVRLWARISCWSSAQPPSRRRSRLCCGCRVR